MVTYVSGEVKAKVTVFHQIVHIVVLVESLLQLDQVSVFFSHDISSVSDLLKPNYLPIICIFMMAGTRRCSAKSFSFRKSSTKWVGKGIL